MSARRVSIAQLEVAIATIGSEQRVGAIERAVVREATRIFGASHATLAFFDASGLPESVTRYTVGAMASEDLALSAEEAFVQQSYEEARPILHAPDDVLPFSAIAVPCRLRGAPAGALGMIFSSSNHDVAQEDLAALGLLGSASAALIENVRVTSYAQQALQSPRDLSERWLGFAEVGPADMVIVLDLEGYIVDADQATCRALGYTWQELVRRHLADIIPSPSKDVDLHLLQQRLRDILATPLWQVESAYVTKSGRVFPIDVRAKAVEVDGQQFILGVVQDITERKRAEGQLAQTERLRVLGEMSAGLVHDLNNTLTAVLGPVEILLASSADALTQQVLPSVRQALLDAAGTVRRIQAFARQQSATTFEPVDLVLLAREVVQLTRPHWQTQAQQQGVTIQVDVSGAGAPPALGSQAELREVLINLLSNAVDALPAGGRITIAVESAGPKVALVFSDSGVGMPPDLLHRVFDPFVTTKGARGTGLGLSVVYGIVKRHRGEIQVESAPGKGTTFTITLPIAEVVARPAETVTAPAETPVTSVAMTRSGALAVLVIDDQPAVAGVLRGMLALGNHRVRMCSTGAEGLAALRDETFDLVCTDLSMPEMSGWEVARAVKADFPTVPVALVTGWDDNYEANKLQSLGVDYILRKPYRMNDVLDLVRQLGPRIAGPAR